MRVLITGGTGFLGQRLARALLDRGTVPDATGRLAPITTLVLADRVPLADETLAADGRVHVATGDLAGLIAGGLAHDADAIFHLAAAVSGECEADFDLGMRANLDTTRALLEACRRLARPPRLVFSSSLAVFGGTMPDVIRDDTRATPQNSYGTQKAMCELLIADCTRRGFVDGRSVRLPTVTVRPGRPNKAASGFMSGILREPLAGVEAVCPVDPALGVWITSPRSAIASLVAALDAPADAWREASALNAPGLSVTVGEMIAALARTAGGAVAARVQVAPDQTIGRIVGGWPWRFETARAAALGLTAPVSMEALVREYIADYPQAIARGT